MLCQYLISLFFPVSLILSLPYINPSFTVPRVKISNVIVSLQDPASPNPRLSLHLISSPCSSTTTWPCHMGLFLFGSSDMQISCLQGFCTYSVCSPCCPRQLLHVLGIKCKPVFLLSCLFHCLRSLAVSHFTTLIIFYLGPFFVSFKVLITI